MKVLITGMDGFIGKEVSRRLRGSGWDVVGFSNGPEAGKTPFIYRGSVTDFDALRSIFDQERPDACVHLAGLAHATVNSGEIDIVRQTNVLGTLNTAEAAAQAGVTQFIFFSSSKVYGEHTPKSGLDEDEDPNPIGIYAEAKYHAEQALADIARKGDLGIVVIRPVAVFGGGDGRGNYARLIRAVRRGVFPVIDGGKARRSIVHLPRVAERIDRILGPRFISGRTYVFSDGEFELIEILKSIRRATGRAFFPPVPGWVANASGGFVDWLVRSAAGKEGHARAALSRLTESFVIRAHHFDSDFGQLKPLNLDLAMTEACALKGLE